MYLEAFRFSIWGFGKSPCNPQYSALNTLPSKGQSSWSYVPNKARTEALKNSDLALPEGYIAKRRGAMMMEL
jgi:hypothetical protein